jgi:Ca-activated chloride channel family protein
MKKCKHFKNQLTAYIHGELGKRDMDALTAHLEDCAVCRAELDVQRATLKLLGEALEAAPAPEKLSAWRTLHREARVPTNRFEKIWYSPQLKSALAAGAIAVCFIFFSGLFVVFTNYPKHQYVSVEPEFEAPSPTSRPSMRLKKPKAKIATSSEPSPSSRIVAKVKTGSQHSFTVPYLMGRGEGLAGGAKAQEEFNTEQYDWIQENAFMLAMDNPLSTFSIDVDRAAYANVRRFLNDNQLPPVDAVRIEEMVNYFDYDYPQPQGEDPFAISLEVASCPWNEDHQLALVGLQGLDVDTSDLPPNNLVFLLDVSGSMNSPDKLPLLQSAMRLLVNQLRPEDSVSIVVYAGAAGLVLEPTSDKGLINEAISRLQAGGSTAGGAGIELAYRTAQQGFLKEGNNRVILATDGDFNVGASSDGELVRLIEEKRKTGIFLTVLGFGTGNYKDSKMEKLADKGNGNYAYIDDILEARKVLVSEMGGTLLTIAKDVKIQVEFNPGQVKAYRLIGYENRVLASEDFDNDLKDAGELGAGHTVTALYELIPAGSDEVIPSAGELKYRKTQLVDSDDLMTVKLRYKQPDGDESKLLVRTINAADFGGQQPSDNFQFASEVAEFGLLLRDSEFKGNASYGQIIERARQVKGDDREGYRAEFINLVEKARLLDESFGD